jgi:Uma2 family endonuclease
MLSALLRFIEDSLAHHDDLVVLPGIDVALETAGSWVIPDLVVVREADVDMRARPFRAMILLAVEILSPSTESLDVGPKRDAYADSAAAEYWTAEPQTGAVTVRVNPHAGEYQTLPADEDGFVESPLLRKRFRVARTGSRFRVMER